MQVYSLNIKFEYKLLGPLIIITVTIICRYHNEDGEYDEIVESYEEKDKNMSIENRRSQITDCINRATRKFMFKYQEELIRIDDSGISLPSD